MILIVFLTTRQFHMRFGQFGDAQLQAPVARYMVEARPSASSEAVLDRAPASRPSTAPHHPRSTRKMATTAIGWAPPEPMHRGFSVASQLSEASSEVARLISRRPPSPLPLSLREARRQELLNQGPQLLATSCGSSSSSINISEVTVGGTASRAATSADGGDVGSPAQAPVAAALPFAATAPTPAALPPTYGFAARVGQRKRPPLGTSDALLTVEPVDPAACVVPVHGRALFYLQTGVQPESLTVKQGTKPAPTRRQRERQQQVMELKRLEAEKQEARKQRTMDAVWARVRAEGGVLQARDVGGGRGRGAEQYVGDNGGEERRGGVGGVGDGARGGVEMQMEMRTMMSGTDRLADTLADVRRQASELQRRLGSSSVVPVL
jgi:hypothetical protein